MMDPRPAGIVLALAGAVGLVISALADPLGIGEGEVFGWLQITGVILGGVVMLLGLVIASERVPMFARRTDVAAGSQNTTIVEESRTERRAP